MTPTGRPYRPRPETQRRLAAWSQGCRLGLTTAEIAAGLGVTVAQLRTVVYRARKRHQHPEAVYHPLALTLGHGVSHLYSARDRARRRRRLEREAGDGRA